MGLDMYLYSGDDQVGYWRKANAIHRWFVANVQDGKDDCGSYPVTREQIGNLLELVERVLEYPSMASTLLPTRAGFFFGSTEYGEWYMSDLEDTRETLRDVLNLHQTEFTYYASW
ncbi:hypothetical protein UFOVP247_11 [uncultured Caudovirales phage]|uniref:Uncharacterized protein n=1 Tax=uncultured Caudovirales phage TaxID=2100421 RepID=A0A6J7WUT5_9CAUD|nr:hypothetical protein UFOVP247_11 [uncultured Caudovirales phage]